MTREEAIAYGKDYYRDLTTACCEIDKKHKEFVKMSIKALEQEPCDDVVSRQAVLNEFYDMENLYERIKQLPSVRPKSETVTEFADRCRECGSHYGRLLKQKSGNWQELKETITEMRDNDGTGTQQEVCKFLVNYMEVLEKQMVEPKESEDKE